jgi:hypothetical protein
MDALSAINPQALFFLQGAGQTNLTRSPGDGFATDPNIIQQYNLSDPNAFFKTLLIRPYVNQVQASALGVANLSNTCISVGDQGQAVARTFAEQDSVLLSSDTLRPSLTTPRLALLHPKLIAMRAGWACGSKHENRPLHVCTAGRHHTVIRCALHQQRLPSGQHRQRTMAASHKLLRLSQRQG